MRTPHRIRDLIAEDLPHLVELRRDLHAHPELGYEEHRTSEVVRDALATCGIAHEGGFAGGTGVLGHLPGRAGQAIALRADMDALPIDEETGLPYASTRPGVMHACGHDGHTAILIGAARVLARLADGNELPRPVTLVFQPAEEGGAGGKRMVEDGCLDGSQLGPRVETIFGLHGWPSDPLGVVTTRPGPMLAAADMFEITLTGVGTHAAMPHRGRDPVVAGAALVTALQTIASRSADPLESIVVSVTQFHAGSTHNVIAETARLSGTVRTLVPAMQELAIDRLRGISDAIARAHGCRADVRYEVGYPVTCNDPAAVATFDRCARFALGDARVQPMAAPVMGGEDFSFYGRQVPACFFTLGLRPDGVGALPNLHHPRFDFNDDAIGTGIEVFCSIALEG